MAPAASRGVPQPRAALTPTLPTGTAGLTQLHDGSHRGGGQPFMPQQSPSSSYRSGTPLSTPHGAHRDARPEPSAYHDCKESRHPPPQRLLRPPLSPHLFQELNPGDGSCRSPCASSQRGSTGTGHRFHRNHQKPGLKGSAHPFPTRGRSCLNPLSGAGRCWSREHNKCNMFVKFTRVSPLSLAQEHFKEST